MGFLEHWGTPGPLRAIVRRENGSKQNELCVVRRESEAEGVRRLNGGQPHPPLPPQLRLGKTREGDGGSLPFLLGLLLRPPPPISVQKRGSGKLGRVPGPWSWGAPGLGAGSAKGGGSDVSGGVCVRP